MLSTRFGLAIVLLVTILSTPCMAAEWLLVSETKPASKYYVDKTSLSYDGGLIDFWMKKVESTGKKSSETLCNETINCWKKQIRTNGCAVYTNGSLDQSLAGNAEFNLIVPDSVADTWFNEFCLPFNHTDQ